MLRRLGYATQIIAKAFGRSTSIVHRILRFNEQLGALRIFDLRKLPTRIKRLQNARQHKSILRFLASWEKWILGEGEKPP